MLCGNSNNKKNKLLYYFVEFRFGWYPDFPKKPKNWTFCGDISPSNLELTEKTTLTQGYHVQEF